MHHQPRSRTAALAIVVALTAVLALGAPAAAQSTTSDPYGPTVPPTTTPLDAICVIDDARVEVGATVTGSVAGAGAGTEVSIRLAGSEVTQVVADGEGDADFSFTVPQLDGGDYDLVAVGVTFTATCRTTDGAGLEVLDDGAGRPDDGGTGGTDTGSDSGGGSLARTGATLLPLVFAALALLLVGVALRRRGRKAAMAT